MRHWSRIVIRSKFRIWEFFFLMRRKYFFGGGLSSLGQCSIFPVTLTAYLIGLLENIRQYLSGPRIFLLTPWLHGIVGNAGFLIDRRFHSNRSRALVRHNLILQSPYKDDIKKQFIFSGFRFLTTKPLRKMRFYDPPDKGLSVNIIPKLENT